jgi:branched-chain amino acid transport system ATP-binding protein
MKTQTMLSIKNVAKYFGGVKAVDGASMDIPKGKIIGVIGPNGSGKSTLFHLISHISEKDKGSIFFNEAKVGSLKDYEIARLGISRTFQEVRLFKNLTIEEHMFIALATDDESLLKSFIGKIGWHSKMQKQIKEILTFVHLKKPLGTFVTDLSYGQRKLLDLALAIAKPHQLLMLDEPVAGVNPKLRGDIKTILRGLRKQGETVLLIEHDMNFVMNLVDYIFVMDYGKVIAEGKPKQIQRSKKVLEAYLGE